jgi:GNAT superfamily N-acetyltransferase
MTIVISSHYDTGRPPLHLVHPAPKLGVWLAPAAATDTAAVLAMLSRCSRQSLYHRFHGYTDGVAYTRSLLSQGRSDDNLLAWNGSTCIGMATTGCDERGAAHLGVLVEDRWQRQGVGTRFIRALTEAARSRGVTRIHADVLGEDQFLLRTLRRVGPLKVAIDLGTFSVDVDLAA